MLCFATLSFAARLAARIVMTVVMTEESTKAPAATTMAGFRLGLQTHENHGNRRQTQGYSH
jgi:hypothetical protein